MWRNYVDRGQRVTTKPKRQLMVVINDGNHKRTADIQSKVKACTAYAHFVVFLLFMSIQIVHHRFHATIVWKHQTDVILQVLTGI